MLCCLCLLQVRHYKMEAWLVEGREERKKERRRRNAQWCREDTWVASQQAVQIEYYQSWA